MTDSLAKAYLISEINKKKEKVLRQHTTKILEETKNMIPKHLRRKEMTREGAITVLENIKMDLEHYRDLFMYSNDINSVIERIKQPPTLAEFLGWEEGQEYRSDIGGIYKIENDVIAIKYGEPDNFDTSSVNGWINRLRQAKKVDNSLAKYLLSEAGWKDGDIYEFRDWYYKIENGVLFYKVSENDDWKKSDELYRRRYLFRAEAKKVEKPKLKAWHVKDEYSFKELQKELESKGFHKNKAQEHLPADYFKDNNCIYVYVENEMWQTSNLKNLPMGRYIIEYHKEEPKYFLQSNLKGDRGTQYFSFDRNKKRKFFASELFGDDKYTQIFTKEEAEELQKENAYAALCEMVEVK